MKNYFLIAFLSLLVFDCYSQNPKPNGNKNTVDLAFISNEKIKYSIVLKSCVTCVPISNIGYRVRVHLSKEEEVKVRNITSETWKVLLNNSNSDWAANLILYSIYDKDAFLLENYNDREFWFKYFKKEDLDFWNKKLNK